MAWPEPMATAPDKFASSGRAWRRDLDAVRHSAGVPPGDDAMLVSWIIEAPWAHPIWHSYNLTLVHLRPTERNPYPIIYVPDATHEIMLFALNATWPREPMLRQDCMRWLKPANFGAQLVEPSDETAIAQVATIVDGIIWGGLNPDTDALTQWVALVGDAMIRPECRQARR